MVNAQTMDGYKELLIGLYRKIVDAGNEYSNMTVFDEKEVTKLRSLNCLQSVQCELDVRDRSQRFQYIHVQAKHTRMISILFELTETGTRSYSDHVKRLLT